MLGAFRLGPAFGVLSSLVVVVREEDLLNALKVVRAPDGGELGADERSEFGADVLVVDTSVVVHAAGRSLCGQLYIN